MDTKPGSEKYIFISYAHKDKETAMRFIEALSKYCDVWYDKYINAGKEWTYVLSEKVRNCSLFIALLSESFYASENCLDELHLARDCGRPFINVRIQDVPLPDGLRLRYGRYQFFDFFLYNNADEAVEALLDEGDLDEAKNNASCLQELIRKTRLLVAATEQIAKNVTERDLAASEKFRIVNRTVEFGFYCGKPVEWEVKEVRGNEAFLVSKYIIEAARFDDDETDYGRSELRGWLNDRFYKTVFDPNERRMIKERRIKGNERPEYVSLLSAAQIEQFFPNKDDRIKTGTKHAEENGLVTGRSGGGIWWLSSLDPKTHYVNRVFANGSIGYDDDFGDAGIGVVPGIVVEVL